MENVKTDTEALLDMSQAVDNTRKNIMERRKELNKVLVACGQGWQDKWYDQVTEAIKSYNHASDETLEMLSHMESSLDELYKISCEYSKSKN